jgi:hypothetical protein
MPYTQVSNLDFSDIKTALKEYLRSQSDFTDYDFDGSAWSILLDVLAYNTYYTAFNTNMVVNELFLDSATLRDNVVAIAKQLGYVPKSYTAPVARINFQVNYVGSGSLPKTAILNPGSAFTTIFDSSLYQYSILDTITSPIINGVASFENVPIYEGSLVKNYYTVNTALKSQRFIINNRGLDTSSIRVRVYQSQNSSYYEIYDFANNILNINPQSKVYFLNEIEDENYELIFGDGILGKKLENNQYVEISYLVTNGETTNGAKTFVFNGIITNNDNIVGSNITVNVVSTTPSYGGSNIEDVGSIKKNAPMFYSSQNRAVTSSDYSAIIRKIYPQISDIIVYGGENARPPEYGKVKIAIKPKNSALLSTLTKNQILTNLQPYMVGSVSADIIDPSILYIELNSDIFYDRNKTNQAPLEIKSKVISTVEKYINSSEIEKFNSKFRYSKLMSAIDQADRSINSNRTEIILRKDFYPQINSKFYYEICYQNKFDHNSDGPTINSTGFVVSEYPQYTVFLQNIDKNVVLYRIDNETNEKIILNASVGEVNFENGEVMLYDLTIIKGSFADNLIELRAKPAFNDINAVREVYLDIDISKSKFTTYAE